MSEEVDEAPVDPEVPPAPTLRDKLREQFGSYKHPISASQIQALFHPSEREQHPELFKVLSDGYLSRPDVQVRLKVALVEAVLSAIEEA